jgi:hypothetical protein
MMQTAYEWFGREKGLFQEYLDPIGRKMDLHFPCKLGGKGFSTVLICMKNNNVAWCACACEGYEFNLSGVV